MKKRKFFKAGLKACIALCVLVLCVQNSMSQFCLPTAETQRAEQEAAGVLPEDVVIKDQIAGTENGYAYELWNQNAQGTACMTNKTGYTFDCEWTGILNYLARRGPRYHQNQTHQQLGTFSASYTCNYTPNNNPGHSYMGIYGWTVDPLVEFYILESWVNRNPSMDNNPQFMGNVGEYSIYRCTRTNAPNITGIDQTFYQYISVRNSAKGTGNITGSINITDHFNAWQNTTQMPMTGKLHEVAFVIEGYNSNGSAQFSQLDITTTYTGPDVSVEKAEIFGYNTDFLRNGYDKVHWMSTESTATFDYDIVPGIAKDKRVTITSNNTSVAVVQDNGDGTFTVTSTGTRGEATITVTPLDPNGTPDELLIATINNFDAHFSFNEIPVGERFFAPSVSDFDPNLSEYYSIYKDVATVNPETGEILAIGVGKTFVIAQVMNGNSRIGINISLVEVISNSGGGGTRIEMRGLGNAGNEEGTLIVDGDTLRTYRFSQDFKTFVANINYNVGDIRFEFTNDDGIENGRDLRLDYISVNGVKRETEAVAVNSGAYANGVCGGGSYTEWLHCNGSVNYGPIQTPHTIKIRARGNNGGEHIDLLINGQAVNSGWWLGTSYQEYTATVYGDGDINVEYDNDGGLKDVVVDWLKVDNQTPRQAENMQYNTGAFANGRCGGGSYTQWMHCNGVIGFGLISANFKSVAASEDMDNEQTEASNDMGNELKTVSIYPNPSKGNFTIDLGSTESNAQITICDLSGRIMYSASGVTSQMVEVAGLKTGLYIVNINNNKGTYNQKLIVQ